MKHEIKDIPTNAYGESPLLEIAAFDNGHFSTKKGAWAIKNLVSVPMVDCCIMRMRVTAVVRVGVSACHA